MTRFRNLFDLLKLSILNSYTKSNFFSRNFARGINGLQALITTNRVVSKQADDLGREHANMKFVKSLWNLAETGLPEKVISWMKPGIKYAKSPLFPFSITFLPISRFLRHKCANELESKISQNLPQSICFVWCFP